MSVRPYQELRDKMSPKARAAAHEKAQEILKEIRLSELRQARKMSQVKLAVKLKINQSGVSKLEKQADMYVSTLRHLIKALGGDLKITAVFPDGEVGINQFKDAGKLQRS
jgi:transcriptional regulator with XRE-family HTH domain